MNRLEFGMFLAGETLVQRCHVGIWAAFTATVSEVVYRLDNEQRIRYFDFFFRLDHSRLVTSQMHWNTELGSELKQRAALLRYAARSKLQRWVTSFAQPALKQAKASVKVIGQDIDRVLQAALVNFNKEFTLLRLDYGRMEQKVADGYEANAFFVKVIKDLGGKIINGIPFKQ